MIPLCPVVYHPDSEMWEVIEDYLYLTNSRLAIVVPAGFLTNLASIPRALWSALAPYELSVEAPVVHDFLYENGGCIRIVDPLTRAECDGIFYEIMAKQNIDIFKRAAAYKAVRELAASHWNGEPDPAEKSEPGINGRPIYG